MTQIIDQNTSESIPILGIPVVEPNGNGRWAYITEWRVEPQSDDRRPMSGDTVNGSASASARRSTARRRHQAMFKAWSQGRHD